MSSTVSSDLDAIFQFVQEAEGKFAQDLCEVKQSPLGGQGVFAKQDIPKGTTLLQLQKNSIFSASNSTIANLLNDEEIDGILALNIAFIYETSVFKDKSHWYPYLKSIKIQDEKTDEVNLPPAYWNEQDKELLRGTTLDTLFDALTPQEEVQRGFEIAIDLAEKWNEEFGLEIPKGYLDVDIQDDEDIRTKFNKFVAVAYAISARVFEIDAFHESALVPIADLFNHHVVTPDLKFISLFDVCDLCGEPGMCKHMLAEEIEEAKELEKEQSYKDKIEKGQKNSNERSTNIDESIIAKLEKDLQKDLQEQINEKEEEAKKEKKLDPDECVDMTTTRDLTAGDEIFNSYGELSNVFLLTRYGFTIPKNPYDVVHLGSRILDLVRNDNDLKERALWWSETGYDRYVSWFNEQFPEEHDHEHNENCDHDHDHEGHEDENDDEMEVEDEGEEEEEEEEQEEDKPWLSDLEIDYHGEPTPALLAACNLFSMGSDQFSEFSAKVDEEPEQMEVLLALDNSKTNALFKKLAKQYREGLQDLSNMEASNIVSEQKECVKALIEAEHTILEKFTSNLNEDK